MIKRLSALCFAGGVFISPCLMAENNQSASDPATDAMIAAIFPVINMLLLDEEISPPEPPFIPKLNDTGILVGAGYPAGNNIDCTGETILQQDCSHGRDVTDNDDTDGRAGFSFTKISATGEALAADATEWACVKDNVTGLMWEKKEASGLNTNTDLFTFYNSDSSTNGGNAGYQLRTDYDVALENRTCVGYIEGDPATYCNTEAFVARMNAANLCGFNDWRMPSLNEAQSLVDISIIDPAIDVGYFPNTLPNRYWTGQSYSGDVVLDENGDPVLDENGEVVHDFTRAWSNFLGALDDGTVEKWQIGLIRLVRKAY